MPIMVYSGILHLFTTCMLLVCKLLHLVFIYHIAQHKFTSQNSNVTTKEIKSNNNI